MKIALALLTASMVSIAIFFAGPFYSTRVLEREIRAGDVGERKYELSAVGRTDTYLIELAIDPTESPILSRELMGDMVSNTRGSLAIPWVLNEDGQAVANGGDDPGQYRPFSSAKTVVGRVSLTQGRQYSLVVRVPDASSQPDAPELRLSVQLHPARLEYRLAFLFYGCLGAALSVLWVLGFLFWRRYQQLRQASAV